MLSGKIQPFNEMAHKRHEDIYMESRQFCNVDVAIILSKYCGDEGRPDVANVLP